MRMCVSIIVTINLRIRPWIIPAWDGPGTGLKRPITGLVRGCPDTRPFIGRFRPIPGPSHAGMIQGRSKDLRRHTRRHTCASMIAITDHQILPGHPGSILCPRRWGRPVSPKGARVEYGPLQRAVPGLSQAVPGKAHICINDAYMCISGQIPGLATLATLAVPGAGEPRNPHGNSGVLRPSRTRASQGAL